MRVRKRVWIWLIVLSLAACIVLAIAAEAILHHAAPILRGRIIETLGARFDSRVELDVLNVSILRGLEVSGSGLRIFPPDSIVAAGARQPLIALRDFNFHSGVIGLFVKPMHVGVVTVSGLRINIPPRELRSSNGEKHKGKMKIVVDEFVCNDSRLIIGTSKPDKDPKEFELKHIELHNIGPSAPWNYEATLINAIPRGEIRSTGTFGPWQTGSPGDSTVAGHYTFNHADLNTIKGIGGMLSSTGDFKGQLDKIVVDGTTDTPDFSLDTANHPLPLHTQFHAVVDGISGDTYLQPVSARLQSSSFTARGAVVNIKGKGHEIDFNVDVPNAQLEDFLELTVKTRPAVMGANIRTKTTLEIRPGKESVSRKLRMQGSFTLENIRFTNPTIQDKVDMISLRAQGSPKEAKPGAPDVNSQMKGTFRMDAGVIHLSDLVYVLPGAQVDLTGDYSLDGQQFDFAGKVLTDASLAHMVASPWKSLLLRGVAPFFRRKGGGAEIPVSITGTRSEPKFGLDVFGHHSDSSQSDSPRKQ